MNFDLNDYTLDVQKYMLEERDCANQSMKKGDIYTNWQGKNFLILEDSPAGNIYVKCKCQDKFGFYIGYRPKIVLVS